MKLLQMTLFSLLMGMTVAAHASSDLDKRYAKCEPIREESLAALEATVEAHRELDRSRNGDARKDARDKYEALKAQSDKLSDRMDHFNCYAVLDEMRVEENRKKREEQGLSPQ